MDGGNQVQLKPEYLAVFSEGISRIFARWTALQMAIENEWGGRLSRNKADMLASDILSFFTHSSKEPLYIDDLEELLYAKTDEYLLMDVQDGSVEEIAEELMIMHEELLHGDLKSIEKLRNCSSSASQSVSRSKQLMSEMNGDDGSSSDEEMSDMAVDEPKSKSRAESKSESSMAMDEQEVEDGWSVVSSKRNKGKKR
ncbi:hypothetical protein ACHQM5_014752 [Ranunculus cassubicifolius]